MNTKPMTPKVADEEEDSEVEGSGVANTLATSFQTDPETLMKTEECYRLVNIIRTRQLRRRTPFRLTQDELAVLPWTEAEMAQIITSRVSKKKVVGLLIEKGRRLMQAFPEIAQSISLDDASSLGSEHCIDVKIDRAAWADIKRDATAAAVNVREIATASLLFALKLGPGLVNPINRTSLMEMKAGS